jgi:hypothetical protein
MVRKERTPLDRALAELAAGHWGVVSLAQLRALGLGSRAVQQRASAGRLHRVHRGVYAVGHRVLRIEGRRLAAVLACGDKAVLSDRSAAAHWGLLAYGGARVEVTAPASRHGAPGIRLHRSRSLDARDTTSHEGMPITTVARTLLDLAATVRNDRLERALAQAMHPLSDHRRHRPRERAPRRIDRGARDGARTQADQERLRGALAGLVRDAGLPEPLVNHTLIALDHGRCEVDFYWPTHPLTVETDGWQTHAALQASGDRVVRFTWRTPDPTILRRLRALLN